MPTTQLAGEDSIVAQLKTIPGVDVIEGEYTEDSYKPEVDENEMFAPYILVTFYPSRSGFDNGLAEPHKDTERATFDVFVVSPNDRLTRDIRDQVKEKLLIAFRPVDGSYIRPKGGYKFVDPDLGFHRYVQVISLTYTFNLS